jgi:hypothetical protein
MFNNFLCVCVCGGGGDRADLWDNVEKFCTAGRAANDNMAHAYLMLGTKSYKHSQNV